MPRLPKYLDLEGLKYYDQKLKEYINWDSAYQKPEDGIPLEDLEASVQQSLANADTALQSETDPTVPAWAKESTKPSYTAAEVGAVPTTRTINGKALSSDITLSAADVNALPADTTIPSALSELSDDSTHRTVTDAEKTAWNNKYDKPQGGIAKTDLDSSVQDSLDLADSALQPEDIASELTDSNQPVSASAVYTAIVEEEEVISAALNDLNSRIENMVVEETDPTVPAWAKEETKPSYTASEVGAVPTSRTINGTSLTSDITLTAADVNAVPTSRTINGKSLSSNITLTATDVNALPASTKLSDLTNDAGFITSSDLADEVSQEDKPITANAVYEYITELEKVIASALNDLNTRLSTYSDKELVIAASLNDLNSRLKTLEG